MIQVERCAADPSNESITWKVGSVETGSSLLKKIERLNHCGNKLKARLKRSVLRSRLKLDTEATLVMSPFDVASAGFFFISLPEFRLK